MRRRCFALLGYYSGIPDLIRQSQKSRTDREKADQSGPKRRKRAHNDMAAVETPMITGAGSSRHYTLKATIGPEIPIIFR
jgi:hypothetical protein